jgi:hypothetical protein
MDLESEVWIYNERLGAQPVKGRLIRVSELGYYELAIRQKDGAFQAYLPVGSTVLVSAKPIPEVESIVVERY